MIKKFGAKTRRLLNIAMFVNVLLIFFALSFCVSLAWYKGTMEASGTIFFDSYIVLEFNGFNRENIEEQWPSSVKFSLVESTDLSVGASHYVDAASINKKNQAGVNDFYEVFTSTAENAEPVSSETLENENFKIEDMLNIYGVFDNNWYRSTDGWFYYSTDGTSLAMLPTSAVNMFVENAHYEVYEDGYSTNASGSTYKVSNTLTIAKYKVCLTLNLLDCSRTPESEGWIFAEDKAGISAEFLAKNKICAQGETTPISELSLTDGSYYDILDSSNKGFRIQVSDSNLTVTEPVASPTDVEVPKYLVVGENVYTFTNLAETAFAGCTTLRTVKLPNSITNIGSSVDGMAFAGCTAIDQFVASGTYTTMEHGGIIVTPYSSKLELVAFAAYGITDYEIPNEIQIINTVFYGYTTLNSIKIPSSVTEISSSIAFINCTNLSIVYIDSSTVASGLSSSTAMGRLIENATDIYIARDLPTHTFITDGVTYSNLGTADGYTHYQKIS